VEGQQGYRGPVRKRQLKTWVEDATKVRRSPGARLLSFNNRRVRGGRVLILNRLSTMEVILPPTTYLGLLCPHRLLQY
jgi:hypothetical protein